MEHLLILAQGTTRNFNNLFGKSILENLPFPVVILCEKRHSSYFESLGNGHAVVTETVKFREESKVFRKAELWHKKIGLCGVVAVDERTVELAAKLREGLGLGGMMPAVAERFRDKVLMKDSLMSTSLRLPEYARCSARADVELLFDKYKKIVLKPVNGCGSKSVQFVRTHEELALWYKDTIDVNTYEAEEYIEGTLYHINAIVRDGKILLSAVAPYIPCAANIDFKDGRPMISVVEPSGEIKRKMDKYSEQVIQTLGLKNGITHLECFLTPENDVVFCEIAARIAGGRLGLMIEAQYGINFVQAMLMLEAGYGSHIEKPEPSSELMSLIGFRQSQVGLVKAVPDEALFSDHWIRYRELPVITGATITPASHCTDYVGMLIFQSSNIVEFNKRSKELLDRFNSNFKVKAS